MAFTVRCQNRACARSARVMGLGTWSCPGCGSEHLLTAGVAHLSIYHGFRRGVGRKVPVPLVAARLKRQADPRPTGLKARLSKMAERWLRPGS